MEWNHCPNLRFPVLSRFRLYEATFWLQWRNASNRNSAYSPNMLKNWVYMVY